MARNLAGFTQARKLVQLTCADPVAVAISWIEDPDSWESTATEVCSAGHLRAALHYDFRVDHMRFGHHVRALTEPGRLDDHSEIRLIAKSCG